jgi:hypothetical protein
MALTFPLTIDTRTGATQDRVLCLGDSFIEGTGNGPGIGNGMCWPLGARILAMQVNKRGMLKAPPNKSILDPKAYLMPWIQDGKSGSGIGDVATNVNVRVIAHNPTIIFYLVSQNDWVDSQSVWTNAANTAFNAIDAALPTVRVCIISNFFGGSEQWTAGGWDQSVGSNASVTQINGYATSWIAGRDQTRYIYMNLRGDAIADANTILNWESVNNTPAPGVTNGLIMDSTGHPAKSQSPVSPYSGYQVVSDLIFSRLNVLT